MSRWLAVVLCLSLSGCGIVDAVSKALTGADPAAEEESAEAETVPGDAHVEKGIEVGGDKGVEVGSDDDHAGVRVGGDKGVVVGSQDDARGVRVGGDKGVLVGKDDDTRGVRVGGGKGVEVGDKGVKIGGKTIIGKKK